MLAPQRLDTPVLVLVRHLTRNSNITASNNSDVQGREGVVGADGRQGVQPGDTLEWSNGTTSCTGREQPRITLLALPSLRASPTSRMPYTASDQTIPSATSKPEGGPKVEVEALPGQNQNTPSLDDARIDAPALPGVDQDITNMGKLPTPASPVAAADTNGPAITVNRPLPGQNQANPIMGNLASTPVLTPPAFATPSPPAPPLFSGPTATLASSIEPITSLVQAATAPTTSLSSTSSVQTPVATFFSSLSLSPVSSFVTITRSEQDKEFSPPTTALSSAVVASVLSTSSTPTSSANLPAIAIAQSFSGIVSSITAVATVTLTPMAIPSNQDGSILHPTARTLLILFVVLGALSLLVAIVIFIMIRSNRKRSRAQKQTVAKQNPFDASSDHTGVTTHISATPNENPFLTASEKAIIDRAASPHVESNANNSPSFSDAISSFIKKSRRLTYKISP